MRLTEFEVRQRYMDHALINAEEQHFRESLGHLFNQRHEYIDNAIHVRSIMFVILKHEVAQSE
jgi:hypothetical protein